jgi:hypothetical protein
MLKCILFMIIADILSTVFYRAVQQRWLLRLFVLSVIIEWVNLTVLQEIFYSHDYALLIACCIGSGLGSLIGMFIWKDTKK